VVSNLKNIFLRYNESMQIIFFLVDISTTFCCADLYHKGCNFASMKRDNSIKEKISEIRCKKGISQEKIAQQLGISANSFRNLEKGKTIIVNKRLRDIADILEVTLEELMLEEDFDTGMTLADVERVRYQKKIESLETEITLLQQELNLLTDKYEGYIKRVK